MVSFVQKMISSSKLRRVEYCCYYMELKRQNKEKKYASQSS